MTGIILTGFVVGVLIGLTGMGGGLLMTPLLILLYGFSPKMAVGTDLVYAATTKAAGTWQHLRQKTVDWNIVWKLICGSVPGGFLGVFLIGFLHQIPGIDVDQIFNKVLGITFICVSLIFIGKMIFHRNQNKSSGIMMKIPITLIGFLGGFLVGLTSVGSGSLFMVALISCTTLTATKLVGTDIVHAFFLTLATGSLHAVYGHVEWNFLLWLLVGSIPGILLGGRLTLKIPDWILRIAIILVLLLTGVKMV
jgi:uncharacterized membrane protein YfcA